MKEKIEDLKRMVEASFRIADELEKQAKEHRKAAKRLLKQMMDK